MNDAPQNLHDMQREMVRDFLAGAVEAMVREGRSRASAIALIRVNVLTFLGEFRRAGHESADALHAAVDDSAVDTVFVREIAAMEKAVH